MTGILVEYARFLEVRKRRARIAEEFTDPSPRTPGDVHKPEPDDKVVSVDVPPAGAPIAPPAAYNRSLTTLS